MSVKDPIKEIMEEYELNITKLKKERDDILHRFKNALNKKQVTYLKHMLYSHETTKSKK